MVRSKGVVRKPSEGLGPEVTEAARAGDPSDFRPEPMTRALHFSRHVSCLVSNASSLHPLAFGRRHCLLLAGVRGAIHSSVVVLSNRYVRVCERLAVVAAMRRHSGGHRSHRSYFVAPPAAGLAPPAAAWIPAIGVADPGALPDLAAGPQCR